MAGKKIKRHTRIYRTNRSYRLSPLRVSLGVLAVLVLFCVGWGMYTPVYNFIMNLGQESSSQAESTQQQSLSPGADGQPTGSSSASSAAADIPTMKAVYLPQSVMTNVASLDSFLAGLKGTDINAVLVDLKDANGNLLYRSQLAEAAEAKAVSSTAFDAAALSLRISNAGYMPVARMHVFKDQVMPKRLFCLADWPICL